MSDESTGGDAETVVLTAPDHLDEAKSDGESTMLLDVDRLRDGAEVDGPQGTVARGPGAEPVESAPAESLHAGHLEQIGADRKRSLDAVFSLLPRGRTLDGATEAVAERFREITGLDHRIRWLGADSAIAPGDSLEFDDGLFTWARIPPKHHRMVAGVQRRVADGWLDALEPELDHLGDDFEFGMVTFLLSEFGAVFGERLGWPPSVWGVDPVEHADLEAMLLSETSPVLELAFEFDLDSTSGVVRMWLPAGMVRDIRERVDRRFEPPSRWNTLRVRQPVVAGRTELARAEFERLRCGDVVMIDRHGVFLDDVSETAVETAAKWPFGRHRQICGQMVETPGGRWALEVRRQELIKRHEEKTVTDTSPNSEPDQTGTEPIDPAVDDAEMTLEIRVGDIAMELSELAGLHTGQIVECDRPVEGPVDLVVDGARIGRGELVCVDGRLGVRILSITR